jgi:hypothetical protein
MPTNHYATHACDSIQALDREVEKVVIFFLKAQGEIANKLLHLRLRMRAIGPLPPLESNSDPSATTGAPPSTSATATHPSHSHHHRRMCVSESPFSN